MRLRSFLKAVWTAPLAVPKVIAVGEKPERVLVRVLEMMTCYGTPILVIILPDGKRLVFVHAREEVRKQFVDACFHWDEYRGNWRDLDVVPWRGPDFPDYKAIENYVRFKYEVPPNDFYP